jgi:predicted metalloprotease with PDZ domain
MLPIAAGARWSSRFEAIGMRLVSEASGARVAEVSFGSAAERIGVLAGDRLVALERDRGGPSAQWLYLPALALVAWVWRRQRTRRAAA